MKALHPTDLKSRAAPLSWIYYGWAAIVAAAHWLHSKLVGQKSPLSRAEEKERRKALITKHTS